MREIGAACVRYGYRKIPVLLEREGFELSKKESGAPIVSGGRPDATVPHANEERGQRARLELR